jgi:PAS domain S-box-containing protein
MSRFGAPARTAAKAGLRKNKPQSSKAQRDSTAEDAAARGLRARELSLRLIIDSIPAPVAVMTPTGEVETVNRAVLEYFGKTLDDLKGWGTSDSVHPDDLPHVAAVWKEAVETGRQYEVESRHRRADGVYRWFHVRGFPLRDTDGRIMRWCVLQTDITDRKQAEERLRRGEAFLAEAQRLSSTGSFSWRVATDEITWSEQLYRTFELDENVPVTLELIGTRIHSEDLSAFKELVARSRRDGSDVEFEFRLQMPDRSVKHLHLVARGSRDERGRLEYIGAVQDVTQRRLSEEALAQARSELAHVARVTSLGVLTASIAHEINQPLAAIVTNGESGLRWLARPEPDVEKVRDLTKRVVADARRASEIIDRIRAMATRQAPKQTLLSLDDIVEDSVAFLRHELRSKSTSVSLDLATALPRIIGDRTQLQQVVVNLAINAVQAMALSGTARRSILIRTMLSNPETVCCTIEDSGPGIDATHIPRLFDTFFTTKDAGMGMGLPISRSIIEAHGGRILADNDSTLGGARFSFALPGQL